MIERNRFVEHRIGLFLPLLGSVSENDQAEFVGDE